MRKYWDDPYTFSFESKISKVIKDEGRLGLILKDTYFFPEGGGQPSDRGSINSHHVIDVQESGEDVVHFVQSGAKEGDEEETPFREGMVVSCEIDQAYRLHNMRTHSACHAIFGAANKLFSDVAYAGFNINDLGNLYLETNRQIGSGELQEIQRLANECVVENRPVRTFQISAQEAAELEGLVYNMELPEGEQVRVVEIEGWDVAACCGTHVRSTIEIGPIKVISRESHKKNVTRIDYAIGKRAVEEIAKDDEILTETAEFLSTSKEQVEEIVRKTSSDLREAEKNVGKLRERLADYKAQELMEGGEAIGGVQLVVDTTDELDQNAVRKMVAKITSEKDSIVAAVIGVGKTLTLAAGCSSDVNVNLSKPIVEIAREHGGGGGGNPGFVNAGGMRGSAREIKGQVEAALKELLQRV